MKILIIMEGFFPGKKYGGPPVSVDNFCKLMKTNKCYVFTTNHEMGEVKPYSTVQSNVWLNRENYFIKYVDKERYNIKGFKDAIREINPNVLYLQGLFQSCILPCLYLAKKMNIKVLLAPRGELCAGAFKKKYKKIPYIIFLRLTKCLKNVSYQSTSKEETEAICKHLRVSERQIFNLTNIPSIPSGSNKRLKKEKGNAKFIFLSRIHSKKNLLFAIELLKKIEGNVIFDIYGPIEDQVYWNACLKQIEQLPDNIKVHYCGLISHEDVHGTFSKYDAFLFPTKSENYGHVIAEALAVGTPVIISDQTPWTDVNNNNAGWALSLDSKDRFEKAIQTIVDCNDDSYFKGAYQYGQKAMNLERIKSEYEDALFSIIN